jgi:hypothetical protein
MRKAKSSRGQGKEQRTLLSHTLEIVLESAPMTVHAGGRGGAVGDMSTCRWALLQRRFTIHSTDLRHMRNGSKEVIVISMFIDEGIWIMKTLSILSTESRYR